MNRRTFLRRAGAACAAASPLLLAGCTGDGEQAGEGGPRQGPAANAAAPDGEPLRVGLLMPTSGVYATLGTTMLQGFNLYADANPGAFGGRRLETVTVDEGETAQSGVDAAQRLLGAEGVELVVGVVSSSVALNIRDLFDGQRVPLLIANAGASVLTGEAASPFVFRTSFSNVQEGAALGQYVYDQVAQRNVFLIGPDYAAGVEHLIGFRTTYERAGGVVRGEVNPPFATTQDYTPFLEQIRDAAPDAVFAFFSGGEAVRFVQQYAQAGLKDAVPLLGTPLTDETVLAAQGAAAEGIRTSLHYALDLDNPTNQAFVAAYRGAYGEDPTSFSVQAYDAAQLLALGLQAANGDTSNVDLLVEALGSVGRIDSPRGPFELDGNRNPVQSFYLRRVEGGRNVFQQDLGIIGDPLAA
jgi:branched-chain amino acid transport system substrate-binding protein